MTLCNSCKIQKNPTVVLIFFSHRSHDTFNCLQKLFNCTPRLPNTPHTPNFLKMGPHTTEFLLWENHYVLSKQWPQKLRFINITGIFFNFPQTPNERLMNENSHSKFVIFSYRSFFSQGFHAMILNSHTFI